MKDIWSFVIHSYTGKLRVRFEGLPGEALIDGTCRPLYLYASEALHTLDQDTWARVQSADLKIVRFDSAGGQLIARLPQK